MSYDLRVYSKRQPRAGDLETFLAREHAPNADGRLKRDGHLLLTDADGVHAEVDGPPMPKPRICRMRRTAPSVAKAGSSRSR